MKGMEGGLNSKVVSELNRAVKTSSPRWNWKVNPKKDMVFVNLETTLSRHKK